MYAGYHARSPWQRAVHPAPPALGNEQTAAPEGLFPNAGSAVTLASNGAMAEQRRYAPTVPSPEYLPA